MQLAEPPTDLIDDDASLFLDFDGTLVNLAPRPDAVAVGTDLHDLLMALKQRLQDRVVLLSGRAAEDVGRYLGPVQLTIGGSHGLERVLPGGRAAAPPRAAGLDGAIAALRQLEADHPGVLIEEKPAGVAVHYRLAPAAEEPCHRAAERAARACGMTLQPGKMVVELKPAGGDKGTAIRAFMAEAPFAGTRPIFVGDDLTDEHGFAAVREFAGAGVLVGQERATAAAYRLPDVAAVRSWLRAACGELA